MAAPRFAHIEVTVAPATRQCFPSLLQVGDMSRHSQSPVESRVQLRFLPLISQESTVWPSRCQSGYPAQEPELAHQKVLDVKDIVLTMKAIKTATW
jgi:hypothetical protein